MECPKCRAGNPDGAEFCSLCFESFKRPPDRLSVERMSSSEGIPVSEIPSPASAGARDVHLRNVAYLFIFLGVWQFINLLFLIVKTYASPRTGPAGPFADGMVISLSAGGIVGALVSICLGVGLKNHKEWARKAGLIYCIFNILFSIRTLFYMFAYVAAHRASVSQVFYPSIGTLVSAYCLYSLAMARHRPA
jgi:hypothetical protein